MKLPVMPPVSPMLAKPVRSIPPGASYEPKWDGFRTIVFRDGDDVHLQSRNGKPMNRYFPEIVPHILALPGKKLVLDGELVIEVKGIQEFDLLSQRIHPAKSRVDMLAEKTPADPSSSPSPMSTIATWLRGARSPLAPTLPCSGTRGTSPALISATTASTRPGRTRGSWKRRP